MKTPTANLAQLSRNELFHLLASAVVIGFVLSFRDWGSGDAIDPTVGTISLLVSIIIAVAVLLLRIAAQKWVALRNGYFLTYSIHKWGIAGSIFLSFFLVGIIPYVSAGTLNIQASKRLRLGSFRYGLNYQDLAMIAIAGTLVNILLMLIIKPIATITQNYFIFKIVQINAAVAFFSLLPLPGSEGFHIFYYRRWLWVFTLVFVGVYFGLILLTGLFSYAVALIVALFTVYIYQKQID